MRIILEIPDNKIDFAKEFFKSISFVKEIKTIEANKITNNLVLESIEAYESGKIQPTPLSLSELKEMIDA